MLGGFREHLSEMQSDMSLLQSKSQFMTNSLSRRRVLQTNLREFMDKVLIEPPLIAVICNKRIDESYVECVSQLMAKQNYIRNNLEEDSAPVKELRIDYSDSTISYSFSSGVGQIKAKGLREDQELPVEEFSSVEEAKDEFSDLSEEHLD